MSGNENDHYNDYDQWAWGTGRNGHDPTHAQLNKIKIRWNRNSEQARKEVVISLSLKKSLRMKAFDIHSIKLLNKNEQ